MPPSMYSLRPTYVNHYLAMAMRYLFQLDPAWPVIRVWVWRGRDVNYYFQAQYEQNLPCANDRVQRAITSSCCVRLDDPAYALFVWLLGMSMVHDSTAHST